MLARQVRPSAAIPGASGAGGSCLALPDRCTSVLGLEKASEPRSRAVQAKATHHPARALHPRAADCVNLHRRLLCTASRLNASSTLHAVQCVMRVVSDGVARVA
jgi:hypothetical protein